AVPPPPPSMVVTDLRREAEREAAALHDSPASSPQNNGGVPVVPPAAPFSTIPETAASGPSCSELHSPKWKKESRLSFFHKRCPPHEQAKSAKTPEGCGSAARIDTSAPHRGRPPLRSRQLSPTNPAAPQRRQRGSLQKRDRWDQPPP